MHIIVYVLDALRADHLSCYGYSRSTSPNIDKVASDGVVFENCFTVATWTRPVAATLLTGLFPIAHGVRTRYDKLNKSILRLPQILNANGWKTLGISTMGNVSSVLGFAEGFETFVDLFMEPRILSKRKLLDAREEGVLDLADRRIALPNADDINDCFFSWFNENIGHNTFSFIWSIETHVPYRPPERFRKFSESIRDGEGEREDVQRAGEKDRDRLIDLYDDEIVYSDHCIGKIVDLLQSKRVYDDTLILIMGDHGEAFYEHGAYTHGHMPYDELLHVPLIIKFPEQAYAGSRVGALCSLLDVYPTIVATSQVEMPESESLLGKDLRVSLENPINALHPYVFSDTQMSNVHNRYISVRDRQWKYIQVHPPRHDKKTGLGLLRYIRERGLARSLLRNPRYFLRRYFHRQTEFLFDLKRDPGEKNNLADARPQETRRLRQLFTLWEEENRRHIPMPGDKASQFEESEILKEHLKRLGYL